MNYIEQMVAELCPNGVEFKTLGEIGELVRGNGMPKSDFADSGIGCIHYGQIYTYYGVWAAETISFVPAAKAAKLAKVAPGDLVITNTSENLEDVCKAVAWVGDTEIVTGGHATVLKHGQNPKYLSYYLQTPQFFAEKKKHAMGTKVIDVSAKNLAKIRIPVPPLPIQQEIVRVLDTFSQLVKELQANLQAELVARRKQYQYYRDQLLSFEGREDVRWGTLGEICTSVVSGGTPKTQRPEYYGGSIPWVRTSEVDYKPIRTTELTISEEGLRNSAAKWIPPNSVIVAMIGATAGKAAWNEIAVTTNQNCCNLIINPEQSNFKFVYYWICKEYENLRALAPGAVPIINAGTIKQYPVPVPPLEVQQEIVTILDKFDRLVNDLSIGLPAEIAARQKQYEYYRNRLLTFPEAA